MVLGVCHKIDRRADHKIRAYDLATDKRLEAVLTRLGMFGIHALVDARPVRQFGGGEAGAVGVARFVPGTVGRVPGDCREGLRLGASPGAGEGLLPGCQALTSA